MNKKALAGVWATCACLLLHAPAAAAGPDVVLYASDAVNFRGNWSRGADGSAAGGQRMSSVDAGWSSTTSASVAPLHSFEFTFTAAANTPYRVWMRVRAIANSKFNDSLYAQFSDAVNSGGGALYRIGSANALVVNLAADAAATSLNSWGWQDGSYWLAQTTTLYFAAGGTHTIRIQTREDGVELDQMVLSPSTYLTRAPGGRTSDRTIVLKPLGTTLPTPRLATTVPAANVVIHASDIPATAVHGAWTHAADPTSPKGIKLTTANLGQTNLTAPPGRAVDYVDVRFDAVAATPYRVAMRLKSRKNSRNNDSLWVQFSNALIKGAPAYTLKSSGGLLVNLASDSGESSLIGWGWQSGAYWLSQPATVTFKATGVQMMRIQFREDGVELDQIVLSPTTYLTSGPGRATNDSTIVPKSTAGVPPPVVAPPVVPPPPVAKPPVAPPPVAKPPVVPPPVAKPPVVPPPVAKPPVVPPPPPPTSPGARTSVPAGGDLQAALNNAQPGDTILLQAGATFTGNFVLPVKSGQSFITIRSSAADALLPGPNTRMHPSYAGLLPKIKSPNSAPALSTAAGAHHYRVQFVEFPPTWQGYYDIVTLGDGSQDQNTLSMVPYQLVLDRVYVHGDPVYGQKRGVALNSASTSVLNSYISGIKAIGQDSQAVGGWNGPGPFTIVNNYLEAAGENILFGGSDPAIPNLVPSDIIIRRNHLSKPLSWRNEPQWTVKNLLELKNAQRVLIDGNVMEHNWLAAQSGPSILFTPRNQDGGSPWVVVQDVQFTNNVVRHVSSGINILGTDYINPSRMTNNIVIRNNLFENLSGVQFGGQGRFFQITGGGRNITVDHNTVLQDGWSVVVAGDPVDGFVFTNNIVPDYSWAITGNGVASGNATIAAYFPGSRFVGNVIAGADPARYPVANYYPASMSDVRFVRYVAMTGGNYRLALTSLYWRAGSDGKDVGVDIDALNAAAGTTY
jgi:hypothetical protein